jgi:LysM repeat protein
VVRGDSFWKISRRFNISLRELLEANGASAEDVLRVGQILQIPKRKIVQNGETYAVQRGDTLSSIGRRYGRTVEEIKQQNSLESNDIRVGQELVISGGGNPLPLAGASRNSTIDDGIQYVVRRGDTLSLIAARYGMTVQEITALNNIRNSNHICEGQRLKLAKGATSTKPLEGMGASPSSSTAPSISGPMVRTDDELMGFFNELDLLNGSN